MNTVPIRYGVDCHVSKLQATIFTFITSSILQGPIRVSSAFLFSPPCPETNYDWIIAPRSRSGKGFLHSADNSYKRHRICPEILALCRFWPFPEGRPPGSYALQICLKPMETLGVSPDRGYLQSGGAPQRELCCNFLLGLFFFLGFADKSKVSIAVHISLADRKSVV